MGGMVCGKVHGKTLAAMKERGGTWAAYQNLGHLRFLRVGPGCTFAEPPHRYPESYLGTGWKYVFVGMVNLSTGEVEEPCGQS